MTPRRKLPTPRPRFIGACLALALIAGSSTGLLATGPASPFARLAYAKDRDDATDLVPLRKIILYRSGVGAFERQGRISGTRVLSLRFEADQINDILKSMVLLDLDAGDIGGVTYASKEPLSRRLASFGVDISDNPSIADLLDQLRGSRVSVDATGGSMTGTILGVEYRETDGGRPDAEPIAQPFLNLVTGGGIRSIAISDIRSFEFEDEDLARELERALAALADHRSENLKSVDLTFKGEENVSRRVVVSYVHEMPVWKTSYRLVLPEESETDPTIQGWAIVENTTDSDWNDVSLSLASGRPVGFTMDLYQPLFAPRPEVPVPFLAGIAPRVFEAGRRVASRAVGGGGGGSPFESAELAAPASKMSDAGARFDYSGDDMANYAAQAQASAGDVGEQFMYTLDQPVTLERQRSAMLPILSARIDGRRVSIYNPAAMPTNPMRGVELTNNSNLHLMPGPISVYDGPAYAGDSQIPHTSRNETQLLTYAVDLDVKGAVDGSSSEEINAIKIVSGVVQHQITKRQWKRYALTSNDAQRGRTMIVEHQRNPGWDLVDTPEPYERTDALYRFEVDLGPGADQTLTVTEQIVTSYTFQIGGYPLDNVSRYLRRGKMSQAVADAIQKASEMQGQIQRLEQQLRDLEKERNDIASDQSRVRQNMQTIDRNSDLYSRYLKKLNDQETRLEEIERERTQLQSELETKRRAFDDFVRGLSVQ